MLVKGCSGVLSNIKYAHCGFGFFGVFLLFLSGLDVTEKQAFNGCLMKKSGVNVSNPFNKGFFTYKSHS